MWWRWRFLSVIQIECLPSIVIQLELPRMFPYKLRSRVRWIPIDYFWAISFKWLDDILSEETSDKRDMERSTTHQARDYLINVLFITFVRNAIYMTTWKVVVSRFKCILRHIPFSAVRKMWQKAGSRKFYRGTKGSQEFLVDIKHLRYKNIAHGTIMSNLNKTCPHFPLWYKTCEHNFL